MIKKITDPINDSILIIGAGENSGSLGRGSPVHCYNWTRVPKGFQICQELRSTYKVGRIILLSFAKTGTQNEPKA